MSLTGQAVNQKWRISITPSPPYLDLIYDIFRQVEIKGQNAQTKLTVN